jgi:hypothetical protein
VPHLVHAEAKRSKAPPFWEWLVASCSSRQYSSSDVRSEHMHAHVVYAQPDACKDKRLNPALTVTSGCGIIILQACTASCSVQYLSGVQLQRGTPTHSRSSERF